MVLSLSRFNGTLKILNVEPRFTSRQETRSFTKTGDVIREDCSNSRYEVIIRHNRYIYDHSLASKLATLTLHDSNLTFQKLQCLLSMELVG